MSLNVRKNIVILLILTVTFLLNACEYDNQCANNDTFCKYQRGDYNDYKECTDKVKACYKVDNYHDISCP